MKIGDRVIVINCGYVYNTYSAMFEKMGFKDQIHPPHAVINGEKGKIIALEKHFTTNDMVVGVEKDSGKQFAINIKGLKVINPSNSDVKILKDEDMKEKVGKNIIFPTKDSISIGEITHNSLVGFYSPRDSKKYAIISNPNSGFGKIDSDMKIWTDYGVSLTQKEYVFKIKEKEEETQFLYFENPSELLSWLSQK